MSANRPGRTRTALSALLARHGVLVDPCDFWVQEGAYRHVTWDLARWGSYEARWASGQAPDGRAWSSKFHVSSWSTMTDCVRHGVVINKEDKFGTWAWVSVESVG